MADRRFACVVALGITQTLAWASSYYLPAVLAVPMARDTGVSTPTVFAAFSLALVVSALLGPLAGSAIDKWGGRPVLAATNGVFALGLIGLSNAHGPLGLLIAWAVLGIGMGSGLYEGAFAALVRWYGAHSRGAITGVTLIAGFASTVGWPLSAFLELKWGWRSTCWVWAGLHLLLALPLNLSLPSAPQGPTPEHPDIGTDVALTTASTAPSPTPKPWTSGLLAFVFMVTLFSSTAMATHLPRLLQLGGASLGAAVAAAALMGPAQVGARILEYGLLRRAHPVLSGRVATVLHPVGALLFALLGAPAAMLLTVLHGAGNGVLTIVKGTLPLALFGAQGYGARQGLLMAPARVAQALAPWAFGLCLDAWGIGSLWLTSGLALMAFAALLLIP